MVLKLFLLILCVCSASFLEEKKQLTVIIFNTSFHVTNNNYSTYTTNSVLRVFSLGSQLWSIKGWKHRWQQHSIQASLTAAKFLWTNQNASICKAANEFASFCIDNSLHQMAISKVCQSGKRIPLTCFLLKTSKIYYLSLYYM